MKGWSPQAEPNCVVEKQPDLIFLCLARDCGNTIPAFFSYIASLESHGLSCAAIIGENGSRDRSRELIEQATHPRVELLDTSCMAKGSSRLVRMAMGRQALLQSFRKRGLTTNYVCVTDLDNVMVAPPSPVLVKQAIERLRNDRHLFAVSATSRPVFYDLLALRTAGHDYSTLNAEIKAAKRRPLDYFQFHKERIYYNQRLMTRPEPIPCTSSFNGFCLYKTQEFLLGTYRSQNEADVCEHVTFNESIARASGKIMLIIPELILQAPADHVPVHIFRFWSDRIIKRVWLAAYFCEKRLKRFTEVLGL